MSQPKDIYWMASPLLAHQRRAYNEKLSELRVPSAIKLVEKEHRFFRNINHWTLEIGDRCYELAVKKPKLRVKDCNLFKDFCQPDWTLKERWHKLRHHPDVKPHRKLVGQTRLTYEEIEKESESDYLHLPFHDALLSSVRRAGPDSDVAFPRRFHLGNLQPRQVLSVHTQLSQLREPPLLTHFDSPP